MQVVDENCLFAALMTFGGMAPFPGTLPQTRESMALLSSSTEGGMSCSTMTGRFTVPSTAESVAMFSLE